MEQFLTESERQELLSELSREREKKYADRIRIILLLDQGEPMVKIAKYFFLTERSVNNYKNRYKQGGLEELLNDYHTGRSSYLSPEEQKSLIVEMEFKVYPTTKSVISYVRKEFGVVYTLGGMTTLLHKLGFSYKKPKGVPGKAKTEEQEVFIKRYKEVKKKGLVYFADSTHPMLNPILSSGWIRRGKEYEVKTDSGRQRVNINGAIEINTLNVVSRSCKRVNGHSMCDLLRAIRLRHPEEMRRIYLVLDNAPYNKSSLLRDLAKELRIKIMYLPPYSPNLNPIERLWKFMKKRVMANKYYPDVETFRKELMLFLRGIRQHRTELSTLITDNFRVVKT